MDLALLGFKSRISNSLERCFLQPHAYLAYLPPWGRTFSTTICRCLVGVALCHLGVVVSKPRLLLPCWTCPTTQGGLCHGFLLQMASTSCLLPSLEQTHGSGESMWVISHIVLAHLYSSTKLEICSKSASLHTCLCWLGPTTSGYSPVSTAMWHVIE